MLTFDILTGSKSTTGSIKSWQNYSKVDAEGVLSDAETMIYQRLRVREMRASETLTVKVGASGVDLPDGFLDPLKLRDVTNDCNIEMVSEEQLEDIRTWTAAVLDSGDPAWFAIFDEQLQFDVKTTTQWKARLVFYKQLDALSESNPSNFLCVRYPHILRSMCLATAARFAKDNDMFQREQQLANAMISDANAADELSRRGQM
jgi:hypothetical protein